MHPVVGDVGRSRFEFSHHFFYYLKNTFTVVLKPWWSLPLVLVFIQVFKQLTLAISCPAVYWRTRWLLPPVVIELTSAIIMMSVYGSLIKPSTGSNQSGTVWYQHEPQRIVFSSDAVARGARSTGGGRSLICQARLALDVYWLAMQITGPVRARQIWTVCMCPRWVAFRWWNSHWIHSWPWDWWGSSYRGDIASP